MSAYLGLPPGATPAGKTALIDLSDEEPLYAGEPERLIRFSRRLQ